MCKCQNISFGSYERTTSMKAPFIQRLDGWVCIDTCLVQEIAELWHLGVETIESCCGHNKNSGYIAVQKKFIQQMLDLGYRHEGNGEEFFIPKLKHL